VETKSITVYRSLEGNHVKALQQSFTFLRKTLLSCQQDEGLKQGLL
jgi:hypothetical protein